MMKIRSIAIGVTAFALITGMSATVASARDLCIEVNDFWQYRFSRVKALRPSGVVALHGALFINGRMEPASGVAVADSTGTVVKMGLFVHNDVTGGNNWTEGAVLDATFTGTGSLDNDGDFVGNFATTYVPVDCATVVLP